MANPKHLEMLRRGADAWNRWRQEYSEEKPDLSEANLRALYLKDANLHHADLRDADLRGVNLNAADLREARLDGADLRHLWFDTADVRVLEPSMYSTQAFVMDRSFEGDAEIQAADLRDANLRDAWLYGANLSDAKLNGADLTDANLSYANLTGSNLAGARFDRTALGDTIFANNDLSDVLGLRTVTHLSESIIGVDTILRSQTDDARFFFRAAGVPQATLDHLAARPKQFYSCFISYSEHDRAFAQRLYADLQRSGVRCWFAPEDLKIGTRLRVGIDESIRAHDKLLLVLSKHSVATTRC